MAFVLVLDTEGREHLVHTSQLGGVRARRAPSNPWPKVWARFDTAKPDAEGGRGR